MKTAEEIRQIIIGTEEERVMYAIEEAASNGEDYTRVRRVSKEMIEKLRANGFTVIEGIDGHVKHEIRWSEI